MCHWHQMEDAQDSSFNLSTHYPDRLVVVKAKDGYKCFLTSALHLAINLLKEFNQVWWSCWFSSRWKTFCFILYFLH